MTRSQLWTVICFVSFMAAGICTTLLGATYESLTLRYGMPLSDGGIFTTVQALGSTISVILAGRLLDRLDARVILCGGPFLFGSGALLLGFAPTLPLGLIGVFLFGFGFGMMLAGPNFVIATLYHEKAASALNALNFFYGIGAMIGPQLVAFALRQGNFVIAYVIGGSFLLLLTLPFALITIKPEPHTEMDKARRNALNWSLVFPFMALLFCYVGSEVGFGAWIFTQLTKVAAASPDTAALATSTFWGGLTVGRGVATIVLRRLRDDQILPLSIGLMGLGTLLLLLLGQNAALSILFAFLVGFGCGPVFPTTLATVRKLFPQDYGTVSGLLLGIANMGAMVLPWLQGVIGGGRSGGMIVTLGAVVIMLTLLFVTERRIASRPAVTP